jgi:hypothetical protein
MNDESATLPASTSALAAATGLVAIRYTSASVVDVVGSGVLLSALAWGGYMLYLYYQNLID